MTLARAATDTFAGIRPLDTPGFVLAQMRGAGINTVRLYIEAPDYLFDLAHTQGLKVIAGTVQSAST